MLLRSVALAALVGAASARVHVDWGTLHQLEQDFQEEHIVPHIVVEPQHRPRPSPRPTSDIPEPSHVVEEEKEEPLTPEEAETEERKRLQWIAEQV